MTTLAFFSMGLSEMIVICVIALLIFGGRLPEVMTNLGRTYAKFRRGMNELTHPIQQEMRRLDRAVNDPRPAPADEDLPQPATEPPHYALAPGDGPVDETTDEAPTEAPAPSPAAARKPKVSSGGAADEPPPV